MARTRVFIGSSKAASQVAHAIKRGLEGRHAGECTVWDEEVFTLGLGMLERLMVIVRDFEFAVLVWGADDITESKGESKASPRDNVVFEAGLFMGAMGRDRVFIVCDETIELKMPSDLVGVVVGHYQAERVKEEGVSGAGNACDDIAREIKKSRFGQFVGVWRSRYANAADPTFQPVTDEVEIEAIASGIYLNTKPLNVAVRPYSAEAQVHGNQLTGKWHHQKGNTFAEGVFILTTNPLANVMYGYYSGRDDDGAMLFAWWVLAKTDGLNENQIEQHIRWGENALRKHTIAVPPTEVKE